MTVHDPVEAPAYDPLAASRGRIVDADFAKETANLSRTQILQQAGTAMVAQANSAPQNVLRWAPPSLEPGIVSGCRTRKEITSGRAFSQLSGGIRLSAR